MSGARGDLEGPADRPMDWRPIFSRRPPTPPPQHAVLNALRFGFGERGAAFQGGTLRGAMMVLPLPPNWEPHVFQSAVAELAKVSRQAVSEIATRYGVGCNVGHGRLLPLRFALEYAVRHGATPPADWLAYADTDLETVQRAVFGDDRHASSDAECRAYGERLARHNRERQESENRNRESAAAAEPLLPARIEVPRGAPLRHTQRMAIGLDVERLVGGRARSSDDAGALLPIAISSEYAVSRFDWWKGEEYHEILDHSPSSVDLSRAGDGLPFLDSHNASDGNAMLGRVLNLRVGPDKKLRGDVRFSARKVAQDYRHDFLDGIRKEISVGYNIDPNNVQISQADGECKTVRVMRWTPLEVSAVAVPADPTVGA